MDKELSKAIRNGLIGSGVFASLSLFFGIGELMEFGVTLTNILFLIGGLMLVGIYFFVPVFIISLIYYYIRKK